MKTALALLVLLTTAGSGQQSLDRFVNTRFAARVTHIVDGDTIDVLPNGATKVVRVRVFGIDTPERGEPFTGDAARRMRVLVFDRVAQVRGQNIDRYGRLVAEIFIDGQDPGLDLVRSGLACHFTRYSKDAAFAAAQAEARKSGRGFWAAGARKPKCAGAVRSPKF